MFGGEAHDSIVGRGGVPDRSSDTVAAREGLVACAQNGTGQAEELRAMGFTAEDHSLPVSAFSGGWKMRIGLAKLLLCVFSTTARARSDIITSAATMMNTTEYVAASAGCGGVRAVVGRLCTCCDQCPRRCSCFS